jgi:hypothetical protein
MGNDFMVADASIEDVVYSDLTLALFQDSGWYQVDFTYAMPIVWGKNAGCDWFSKKCISSSYTAEWPDYFCTDFATERLERCDFMHLHKGFCNRSTGIAAGVPAAY